MKLPSLQSLIDPNSVPEFTKQYSEAKISYKNWHEQPEELKTKENILKLLELRKDIFPSLSAEMRDDTEVFLTATKYFSVLKHASFRIKNNKDLVTLVLANNAVEIEHAGKSIQNDEIFIITWLKNLNFIPSGIYEKISSKYKHDKHLANFIISSASENYKDLPLELRSDKELALAAVNKNGNLLKFASLDLKNDKEVATSAINNHPGAYIHASPQLKENYDLALMAVSKSGALYSTLPKDFQINDEIILAALNNYGFSYKDMSEFFKIYPEKKREYALKAVKNNGMVLQEMPEFNNDPEIVLTAIQHSGEALEYASKNLQDDYQMVYESISKRGINLKHASQRLKNDKQLVMCAIEQNPGSLAFASPELVKDKNIVLLAYIRNQGTMMSIVSFIDPNLNNEIKNSGLPPVTYLEKAIFEEKVTAQKEHLDQLIPNKPSVEKKKKI